MEKYENKFLYLCTLLSIEFQNLLYINLNVEALTASIILFENEVYNKLVNMKVNAEYMSLIQEDQCFSKKIYQDIHLIIQMNITERKWCGGSVRVIRLEPSDGNRGKKSFVVPLMLHFQLTEWWEKEFTLIKSLYLQHIGMTVHEN